MEEDLLRPICREGEVFLLRTLSDEYLVSLSGRNYNWRDYYKRFSKMVRDYMCVWL